jgi:molybdopterin molybdotransferase
MIALREAHRLIAGLCPLPACRVAVDKALGLAVAEDVYAAGDCPGIDSSLKDGYAVCSSDIAGATSGSPVILELAGSLAAGDEVAGHRVASGHCLRLLTGAPLPPGATAVLAQEFATVDGSRVTARADAPPGKNVLVRGSDIALGQRVLRAGEIMHPATLGLAAAAGVGSLPVYPRPRVAIVATGSELVWPGEAVDAGKVAASNMVIAAAELQRLGLSPRISLERDDLDQLQGKLAAILPEIDLLITCGGILDGDKDLTMKAMEGLGMEKLFHRVRIGPGKGACCGRIGTTLIFNLPGGPPSHHVALLLLALPGARRLMGYERIFPEKVMVIVEEELHGQKDWTQLVYAAIDNHGGLLKARPLRRLPRLFAMAGAQALLEIPEGCDRLAVGALAEAWIYRP